MDNRKTYASGSEISARTYNLTIGAVLMWGFGINVILCGFFTEFFMQIDFVHLIIGYFVCAFAGIFISKFSTNAFLSFIGYNLVVVPVGVVTSICIEVSGLESVYVLQAFIMTFALSVAMTVGACYFPDFFKRARNVLSTGMIAILICEIIFLIIGKTRPALWDIGVAAIFCIYIGADWIKAQEDEPYTYDKAVDHVVQLYLDIVNLFVRILSAMSKSKRRNRR